MRRINYNDYLRENKAKYTITRLRLKGRRGARRRRRDEKEREILLKMDRARRERWIKEGRLEILGPRRYRLNLE